MRDQAGKAVEAIKAAAPKNQHDKKVPPQKIGEAKHARETDHKIAEAIGSNRRKVYPSRESDLFANPHGKNISLRFVG